MEYVEGRTLRQVIREDGPVPPRRAAEIGADMAAGAAFAHKNGVIHRDFKPGNVLISSNGQVKVTDFGIARAASNAQEALTQTGAVMGTATYFSPEQAQGRPIDYRSDVYAMGIVLYEMVVGRPPFYNENPVAVAYQHARERPVPPRQHNPRIPVAFEAIVLKALAKNPANRYNSAEELRADLMRFRAGKPVLATPAAKAPPPADATTMMSGADRTQAVPATTTVMTDGEGPRRRTGAYVVLLVGLLALLAGGLFLLAHELGLGSSSAAQVTVPAVFGRSQDDATSALKAAGFKVKVVSAENDAAAGTVFDQNPKADAKAHKGDTVTISVSKGPPQVTVPAEIGKNVDAATNDLDQLQLTVVTRGQTSDRPQGEVLDQNPQAGTSVAKNSTVVLTISSGTGQTAVPNVVGRDSADAANILGQAGFKTTTKTQPSDTVDAGKVISTNPAAGTKAAKNSTVTMIVSSGPSPTTTQATTTTVANTATVPDVSGKTRFQASNTLSAAGFNPTFSTANCPSPGTTVQSTNPPAGTSATTGSTVTMIC
jgi:serine/threonine-protein kinase